MPIQIQFWRCCHLVRSHYSLYMLVVLCPVLAMMAEILLVWWIFVLHLDLDHKSR